MLERVVGALLPLGCPIAVVAAPAQALPALHPRAQILVDERAHEGPLTALAHASRALPHDVSRVFVVGTDHPRLNSALVRALDALLGNAHAVVPIVGGSPQPLAAIYRRAALDLARQLVAEGERRMLELVRRSEARLVTASELLADPELARVDPALESLVDLDAPSDVARLVVSNSHSPR
jgi:molybdopterin-guanine dinucleotide biosynthesis protein A